MRSGSAIETAGRCAIKAKKTSSKKQSGPGKRGVKDLPTRKTQDVKGGFRWDIKPNKSG